MRRYYASPDDYLLWDKIDPYVKLPVETKTARMIALVSNTTAAGAEIVTAALQDHKRATIVGTTTFGKGTVEEIRPLRGGVALKITTGTLYRPNGSALESNGVTSDTIVQDASDVTLGFILEPKPDLGLAEALRLLRMQ